MYLVVKVYVTCFNSIALTLVVNVVCEERKKLVEGRVMSVHSIYG